MTNTPTETPDVPLEITDKDTAQCRNLEQFRSHPKFQQFLRLFNMQRNKEGQGQVTLVEVTSETLMKSPSIAEDAFEFFQSLQLRTTPFVLARIHQMIANVNTLIEERRKLFGQLHENETKTFSYLLEQH